MLLAVKKVGVIGAGPAGLMAAGRASELGSRVIIFEKNGRAARKLMITGKGRCNITNACPEDELLRNIPGNGKFLHSAFSRFSNHDIIQFFERLGVPLKTERGNRVFPVSDRASDIVDAMVGYANRSGAEFRYRAPVSGIICENGAVKGVRLQNDDFIELDSVVLATGGMSYPLTGSTGDGYAMAREMGHTVTTLNPSLVPLETRETWVGRVKGLTLKNVGLSVYDTGKRLVYRDQGELLFTHFGVSGPMILSASRHILECGFRGAELVIDMKPALDEETLDRRIQRDFGKYSRKQLSNSFDDLLPKSMIPVFIDLLGIPPEKPVNQITKSDRKAIVSLLKGIWLTVSGARPIDEAVVTAGGVSIREIDPKTMESKLIKGLFFAGEIIDVDAYTGGFNLTIAISTGYAAGSSV
jgi:predicted Rossmann fold flavoprotein